MTRPSRIWALATAVLLAFNVVPASSRAETKPVPAGGDPALACGQMPEGRAYWTEYAFCDLPVRGPGRAKGLIFWSHGVSGKNVEYATTTPPFLRDFVQAGWDVIKIDRNNLYETCTTGGGNLLNCWTGGTRHVDDLIERAKAARAQGYQRVIAAGQSFGGAISVEANARAPELFWAVIAMSPGHGSDAADGSGGRGTYYTLDKQLLDVLARQRSGRIVVSLPPFDAYSPNRDSDPIWPKARAALQGTGRPFVLLGEGLPINGHGAATTGQFAAWFGDCLRDFVDPAHAAPAGETKCLSPQRVPDFLLPAGLKIPAAGTGAARWLGAWEGTYIEDGRPLLIVVESVENGTAKLVYSTGAGAHRDMSMGFQRYTRARVEGDKIIVDRGGGRILTLTLSADGTRVDALHTLAGGRATCSLSRWAGEP